MPVKIIVIVILIYILHLSIIDSHISIVEQSQKNELVPTIR